MNRGFLPVFLAAIGASSCSTSFDVGPVVGSAPPVDGGADGSDGQAQPRAVKCPVAGAEFCADFEASRVDEGWDDKGESNGGTVTLDSARGFESAQSASCRSVQTDNPLRASLSKRLTGATTLTVDLDAWITTPAWGDGPNFGLLGVEIGTNVGFYMVVSRESVDITSKTPDFSGTQSAGPFPYDRWVHVSFTVDWNARSATATIGDETVSHPFTPTAGLGADPTTNVEVGILGFNPPEPGVTVSLDNVVITRR